MPHSIFFSWQSDTHANTGRTLIFKALQQAVEGLKDDSSIEEANRELTVEKDTTGLSGTPPIVETILNRIDDALAFVADLTFVAATPGKKKLSPNPNVLIEYGWALKSKGWPRVIAVLNKPYGCPPKNPLPFDLLGSRWPHFYDCPANASPEVKAAALKDLTSFFKKAIGAILRDELYLASLVPKVTAEPHPRDVQLLERIDGTFDENVRRFLRTDAFGGPIRRRFLDVVYELAEWRGAHYEFVDSVIQERFVLLLEVAGEFSYYAATNTFVVDGSCGELVSARTDMDRRTGSGPELARRISGLQGKAAALTQALDDFDRVARTRVRIPSKIHATTPASDPSEIERAREALGALVADEPRQAVPEIVPAPCLILRLAPFAAATAGRLDPELASRAISRLALNIERYSEGVDERQWWVSGQPKMISGPNPEVDWLSRLVRPGYLEHRATIGWRERGDDVVLVSGRALEGRILRGLEMLVRGARFLGLQGGALASVTLDGLVGVELTEPASGKRFRNPSVSVPELRIDLSDAELSHRLRDTFDRIWNAAGWPGGSPSFGDGTWAGNRTPHLYET